MKYVSTLARCLCRLVTLALMIVAISACQPITRPSEAEMTHSETKALPNEFVALFDYDSSAPLGVEVVTSEPQGNVTIQDITFPSPVNNQLIAAYLIAPAGKGPFPGVLYAHWYASEEDNSNRTQFLEEATNFARDHSVVALLVETIWEETSWYTEGRTLESDFADTVRQTIDLRRALDVLSAQPGVDANRLAFVGHDFGAMQGATLAAVDRRAKAYVLIAGTANYNNWMLFTVKEDDPRLPEYTAKMEALAPTRVIAHAAPAPVLLQFGTEDFFTPADDIQAFFDAASEPKTLKSYPAEHAMDLPEILQDRLDFLSEQLGL